MKKYLFFLSAVSIALFTACSSADDLAESEPEGLTPEERAAIIAEANMDSEVQIRLGMGSRSSSITRAPLESDEDGLFTTPTASDPGGAKYLGIYCLAQKNQKDVADPGPVAPTSILWNSNDATKLFYLMNRNQAARVVKVTGGTVGNVDLAPDQSVSEVQFMNGSLTDSQIYFYPYGNWYNYYFYGYYPRQEASYISETSNKISVNYTITGTEDIIYGSAAPSGADADEGYNAKYMRKLQTDGDDLSDLPKLAMNHKLAQLRFYVKTSSNSYIKDGYGIGNGDKKFKIENLQMTQVPDGWTLTIADRTTPANEGKLTRNGSSLATINVKQMTLNNDGSVNTSSDENTFNQSNLENSRQDILYTGSELSYWKVVAGTTPGTYVWQASTKELYDADGSHVELAKNADLPAAIQENLGKNYRVWKDVNANNEPDEKANDPLFLGYAMVPTTEMMTGQTITGRGDATIPYVDFKIYYTNGAGGDSWTFTDQAITKPADGFEAGKVYNVILNIPTPEEIAMIATLEDWEWVSVTAGGAQNINVEVE